MVMVFVSWNVMEAWPHMYVQECAAHCLDLLLEDWRKAEWVKTTVRKVHTICLFIKSHHTSQAIFQKLSTNHATCLPLHTHFATNITIIDCILQIGNAHERMIVDND